MFFFKKKKLAEIEIKVDRLLQMLEKQSQDINDYENDNRQFLSGLIIEKTESLSNEGKCRIEDIEKKLMVAEKKIIASVEKSIKDTKSMHLAQESRDETMKKDLNDIWKNIEKAQKARAELVDKLDLIENEIRLLLLNSVMDQIPEK